MMYPLHYTGVKSMDLKKTFCIKDDTTKHIHVADIHNDPDMEYSSFTKAHQRSMIRLVQECSCCICEVVCLNNAESILNDIAGLLSEFPALKQHTDMVQSMVQIYPELLLSSIQWRALFTPLAQHFVMKKLQKFTQYNFGDDESIGRECFCCGRSEFVRLLEGRNIMTAVIYYQRQSMEATKRAIKWIVIPDNPMTLSWGTVKFKLDKKCVLLPFIIRCKR